MVHPIIIVLIIYLGIWGINRFEQEVDAMGLYRTPKEKEYVIKGGGIGIILILLYLHQSKVLLQVKILMDKKRIELASSQFNRYT